MSIHQYTSVHIIEHQNISVHISTHQYRSAHMRTHQYTFVSSAPKPKRYFTISHANSTSPDDILRYFDQTVQPITISYNNSRKPPAGTIRYDTRLAHDYRQTALAHFKHGLKCESARRRPVGKIRERGSRTGGSLISRLESSKGAWRKLLRRILVAEHD